MDRVLHPRVAAALVAVAVLAALGVAWRAGADPAGGWTVASPGGALTARVSARGGALALTVLRAGRPVLATPLGRGDASATQDTIREAYETPAGKRRRHELVARRLRIALPHGRGVELLVADDGVALRTTGAGREVAAWQAPTGARAWLQAYRRDYEGPYVPVALRAAKAGDYGFPALVRTGDTWALLTESGLRRQAAARLTIRPSRRPSGRAPAGRGRSRARRPWRVAVVGDLPAVVGSDLPLSLGRPSQIRDTSWIKPGRVAWSWWSDRDSPGDIARQRAFVREAAAHRWEYVCSTTAGTRPRCPGSRRTPRRRGVRVMVWTEWWKLRDARRRAQLFDRWARVGRRGVKVDFLLSDSAARMEVYDDIARDAAQRKLTVVFHGCTVPRGIQRTWPNVLTMEAVRGRRARDPAQGREGDGPAPGRRPRVHPQRHRVDGLHAGHVLGAPPRQHRRAPPRARRRLRVGPRSTSPISPESYARHPQAAQVLDGRPDRVGRHPPARRRARPRGDRRPPRRAGVVDRLGLRDGARTSRRCRSTSSPPGVTYRLHLVRDDGHGGLAAEDRTVTSADRLSVAVERNGGYTAECTPWTMPGDPWSARAIAIEKERHHVRQPRVPLRRRLRRHRRRRGRLRGRVRAARRWGRSGPSTRR